MKQLLAKMIFEKAVDVFEDKVTGEKKEKVVNKVSKKKASSWLAALILAVLGALVEFDVITPEQAGMAEKAIESDIGTSVIGKVEDKIEDAAD